MIDFNTRLKRLKDRRQGTRELFLAENGYNSWDSGDYRTREHYEKIAESAGVRYALGAMAAVSEQSTLISKKEGNRVADTLIDMLGTEGINAVKRMQGSVALDIHIEGHSDVDMLIIYSDTVLVETPKLDGSSCYSPDSRSMEDIVAELRKVSEEKLTSRYWQATVDCSNSKSIALEGGSLKRKVDIVPASWYRTHEYQRTGQEKDSGVDIYNKKEHSLIRNYPFKHIDRVNERDAMYSGNLKKVTRLLKNVVADMPEYKKSKAKQLTSYDLAGIAYHMDNELNVPGYMSLSLVEKAREFLLLLTELPSKRDSLIVPDGTRKIFDNIKKVEALEVLEKEVSDLAFSIFQELQPHATTYDSDIIKNKVVI
ncbi:hypothetical protein [Vibrio antiquarius]|uniref:hypothetical protein n=1 Tax=Vibrio antiquarius (strain Ex25) TaxID=150340 RepID=UPI002658E757|nr:hypothetical protein [Vibrio antiquarius]MCR9965534.1 hypothetical protein [Vibrio antiquarius]